MTFDQFNEKLAAILPGYRFRLGYRGTIWLTGPAVNFTVRLAKDGALIRTNGGKSSGITLEQAHQVGALVQEYRQQGG